MKTPIENAREVAAHMPNSHLIEVIRGGHGAYNSLFQQWDPMFELLSDFVSGNPINPPSTVLMDELEFG